jgi:hypothetical protein
MFGRIGVVVAVVAALCASTSAARADAPSDVFAGAGVFVDSPANFPGPWALADELQADHFTWIALHVEDFEMLYLTEPLWIQVMRDHGLQVGVWGTEWSDPIVSAFMADVAIRSFGFDFYIADAEGPYEKKGAWRSSQFVQEFRALQPTIPAALVTLGAAKAPYVLPIDYAAWRNAGFSLLPEAYYNQYKGYRPDLTVAHAIRAGWPASLVHPVIGVYHHYPASRYVPLLQTDGASGFSVFLADQATAADFAALSQLAAATVSSG